MPAKKLSPSARAVLAKANEQPDRTIGWHDATQVGGNAATLKSLTTAKLLERLDHPDGSKDWKITPEGVAALNAA